MGAGSVVGGAISVVGGIGVEVVAWPAGAGAGGGAEVARPSCAGLIPADMFITSGSSAVIGAGLVGSAPGDARDSPSCGPGNVSSFAGLSCQQPASAIARIVIFMRSTSCEPRARSTR
jgi:hypothetical protein